MNQLIRGKDILERAPKGGGSIGIGIHSNVSLSSVVGENFLEITATDENGKTRNKRYYFPEPGKSFKRDDETQQEADERDFNAKVDQLASIIRTIGGKEAVENILAENFAGLAEIVNKAVNESSDTFNIKVIYDYKGEWPTLPNWNWLEKYKEGQEPTLQYTKYELENRLTPKAAPTTDDVVVSDLPSDLF